jgi:predicted MarR family transcription regulator
MSAVSGRAVDVALEGDELPQFDWAVLVPQAIHPRRVEIIEAMRWLDNPLSSSDLVQVLDKKFTVNHLAYHVRELWKAGALEKTRTRQVRGAMETYYKLVVK